MASQTDLKTVDVLITRPLMPLIMDGVTQAFRTHRLWTAPDEAAWIAENAASIRGIVGNFHAMPMDPAFLSRFPKLEIVANFGVGYDAVDAGWCGRNGVTVTNTPGVLSAEVADLALGLLLATVRQLPQADAFLRRGDWLKGGFPLTATLRGRKIGILGLGRIGKEVAVRAEAFGLEVHYHGRSRQADVAYPWHASLVDLAKAVDILLSVAPGTPETHHLIDMEVLRALGPEGILINVGRGSVVDEKALIAALTDGTIMTAGLDVFEDEPKVPAELVAMPHVVLLPHVGSASHHTRGLMGQLVVDNLLAWFEGRGPLTPVPETPWPAGKTSPR